MSTGRKAILGVVLLALVFLAGFLPQFLKIRGLENDLAAARTRVQTCELKSSAGMMLLETSRNNFGLAAEESARFFTEIGRLQAQTPEPNLKTTLEQIGARRDTVTSGLAKADPAVRAEVQELAALVFRRLQP